MSEVKGRYQVCGTVVHFLNLTPKALVSSGFVRLWLRNGSDLRDEFRRRRVRNENDAPAADEVVIGPFPVVLSRFARSPGNDVNGRSPCPIRAVSASSILLFAASSAVRCLLPSSKADFDSSTSSLSSLAPSFRSSGNPYFCRTVSSALIFAVSTFFSALKKRRALDDCEKGSAL